MANELGFEATCNRDRGMLGCSDRTLREQAQEEGYIVVTDNASDFRPMFARDEIHPGPVVMPGSPGRDGLQRLARSVLDDIVAAAEEAGEPTADYMVNKLVEIDEGGACTVRNFRSRRCNAAVI